MKSLKFRYSGCIVMTFLPLLLCPADFAGAAEPQEAPGSFAGSKDFKPAQRDLLAIYLQIADVLTKFGTPQPYLAHVKAEHARIEADYRRKTGNELASRCPTYMTDEYLARLAKNWALLAPKLNLAPMTKNIGQQMGNALADKTDAGQSTTNLLRRYQQKIFQSMSGGTSTEADFDFFTTSLLAALNEPPVAGRRKDDLPVAVILAIQGTREQLMKTVDSALAPSDAQKVKNALDSVFRDVGRMAQSEFEAATIEWALHETEAGPYNPAEEVNLNSNEKAALTNLLAKKQFEKKDFPALENFYTGAYDRLSERGRDEISRRVWRGTRK